MPTLKRSNNNIHIGEGPQEDPYFIGNAKNRVTGDNIIIQESDELKSPQSANISTDLPDDVLLDSETGDSYGIFHGGNAVIKYGQDGTNDLVYINNGSNLNTIGLFRSASGVLFIIVVDYDSSGCKVLYKQESGIVYGGQYQSFLELSIDFTNVTVKYTHDDNDVLFEGNGDLGYKFRNDSGTTDYDRFYDPTLSEDEMSEEHWNDSIQFSKNNIASNLSSTPHFLEGSSVGEGFWVNQITSTINTVNESAPSQIYFQISAAGQYYPTAIPWTHCVVFKTMLDVSGEFLSISESDPIEPVFAPVFYTACGTNVDITKPISIPSKIGKHFGNMNTIYAEQFEENFNPSYVNFGENSGDSDPFKSYCMEYMVLTPFGPIERMRDWLFTDRFQYNQYQGAIPFMHQPFIHRWAFVVDREVNFFGQGYSVNPDTITVSGQKLLNVSSDPDQVGFGYVYNEPLQLTDWQPDDYRDTEFTNSDLFSEAYDYQVPGYPSYDVDPWRPVPYFQTNTTTNVGIKTREMFRDRFLNNIFVNTKNSNGWESGVNYPRKSIRLSRDPNLSANQTYAHVSFAPNESSAMIYTDAAITWGIKQFSGDPKPWCTISTNGTELRFDTAITLKAIPPSYFSDTDEAPFARASIERASINTVSNFSQFNFYNDIDIIVSNSEHEPASITHAVVEDIADSDYGIPLSYEVDNSSVADSPEQLNDRKYSIAECGSSFKWTSQVTNAYQDIVRGSFYKIEDENQETNESVNNNPWGLGGAKFFWDEVMSHPFGLSLSHSGVGSGGNAYSNVSYWRASYGAESNLISAATRVYYLSYIQSPVFGSITIDSGAISRLTAPAYSNMAHGYTNGMGNFFSLNLLDTSYAGEEGPLRMFFKDFSDNDKVYYGKLNSGYGIDNSSTYHYKVQDYYFTSDNNVNAIAANLVVSITSQQSDDSSAANFVGSYQLEYAASYLYDNFQEGPLSTKLHTVSATDNTRDYWELTIKFLEPSLPKRVTHINLYRKYVKTDGTGDVMYKFIHSQPIFPVLNLNETAIENEYSYVFLDYNKPAPSYDAIVGISEVLRSHSLRYGISASSDSYLFVSNASVIFDPASDYSNYIFRSMPNGRFSQFNWAVDYVRLEDKPNALTTFNGRLYAFTESKLFIINQSTLEVENTLQGVGCLGPEALISTEYGLCFADQNNIYLMRDKGPEIISSTIAKRTFFSSYEDFGIFLPRGGWQDYDKMNVHVSFDMKRKSFLIFFSISENFNNYVWSYNIIYNRWDLLESPVSVKGTFIKENGELILGGVTNSGPIVDAKFFNFLGGTGSKNWSWFSKLINLGAATQDKKFHSFKISSNFDPLTTGGYNVDNSTIIFSDRDNKVSNSTWVAEQNGSNNDWTTTVELASGQDNKFKNIQLSLLQYSGSVVVDSIGLVYTPKRVK